jgi:hypothetical protein
MYICDVVQIYSTLLMGIVFAAYSTVAYFGLAPYGTASLLLNASVFLMSLVSLLAVSLLSQMTSAEDKIYCILYSSLGFIGAVAYFAMEPEGVFLWSPEGGAQAAASLLKSVVQNALARSNMDSHPLIDNIEAPLSLLGIIFAVLAAFMTAVLHGSALRFARTFHSHTSPPVWAKQYMESMFLDTLRLRIQMVAPMFLPVLYMNLPMDEILGLQADTIMLVQSAALVATGILFIINSRIVVARYLETAFIAWYTVKHGQHRNKVEKTAAYTILKAKADIVRYTSCKTAIQAIAPGVLYLSCGLLSLGSYLYMMTSPDDGNIADYTSQFVQNAVGFVVTFVGALWFIVCGFSLWLFRTGTVIY